MTGDKAPTAKEIAEAMGKSTRAIEIRAKKEKWPFVMENGNGRGGKTKKYPLPTMPPDVQVAIYNKNGAPAAMLPMLSPAVALAAMERPVSVPTFAETLRPARATRVRRGASRVGSLLPEVASAAPAHNTNSTETITIDMRRPGAEAREHCLNKPLVAMSSECSKAIPAPFPMSACGLEPARRYLRVRLKAGA